MIINDISVSITLEHSDIVTILSGEAGGFDYWGRIEPDHKLYVQAKQKLLESGKFTEEDLCYEDILAEMLLSGKILKIIDQEDPDKIYRVSYGMLKKGVEQNYIDFPEDRDLEEGDALTCDRIMQYAVFGDIIFG